MSCVRCDEPNVPPERPYCVACCFAVRAEIEDGLRKLGRYLAAHAAFDAWDAARR